jgi:hypothetical protein
MDLLHNYNIYLKGTGPSFALYLLVRTITLVGEGLIIVHTYTPYLQQSWA